MTCIFPHESFVTEDKNAASLVLYYEEENVTGLFTGDIGEQEEKWIAEHSREWMDKKDRLTVYKAAHHGSKYSNSEEFLQKIQPEIAVVSSGVNNSYGHPHEEAVERIGEIGCEIWCTAECGQVTINIVEDKIEVSGFLGKEKKVDGVK